MEAQGHLRHSTELHSPNGAQEILFHLKYPIVEDIPAEIEEFVRLSRFGLVTDARTLFDRSLKEHLNLFPVLAEYADFLLEQDNLVALKECSKLLGGYLESEEAAFSDDEVQLLRLLQAFSDAKAQGSQGRKFALDAARNWHRACASTNSTFDEVDLERDEAGIHGLEIYLAILADACKATPNMLKREDYILPSAQEQSTEGWSAFQSWCHILNEEKRPWEAQKVLKSLLKVLDARVMHQFYSDYIETLERFNRGDAYCFSRVAAANTYVALSIEKSVLEDLPDRVQAESEEAHSLLLFFENQGALQGHHFEQWKRNSSKLQELQLLDNPNGPHKEVNHRSRERKRSCSPDTGTKEDKKKSIKISISGSDSSSRVSLPGYSRLALDPLPLGGGKDVPHAGPYRSEFLSGICAAARIASEVFNLGFSQYQNAKQEYADFGKKIHLFGEHLDTVQKVIEMADTQRPGLHISNWDFDLLDPFETIVGDYQDTLNQCKTMIEQNPQLERGRFGFVYNVQWTSGIQEQVRFLHNRIAFHCSKLALVLKPLEIKVYSDITRTILEGHGGPIAKRIDELKAVLLSNVREAIASLENQIADLPKVPEYLAQRFQNIASESRPTNPPPLIDCIDAVAYHFEKSTRKIREYPPLLMRPDPGEYLNLVKCVWILHQITGHPKFRSLSRNILWKAYVRELEVMVLAEDKRFKTAGTPLRAPSAEDILREPQANFSIWVDLGEVDDLPTLAYSIPRRPVIDDLFWEQNFSAMMAFDPRHTLLSSTFEASPPERDGSQPATQPASHALLSPQLTNTPSPMEQYQTIHTGAEPSGLEVEVFEALLLDISRSREQNLVVSRLSEHHIRIVRTVTSTTGIERESHVIDTTQITLLPLYAFPGIKNTAPYMSWRATASDQRTRALMFTCLQDALRMQEAITNFEVVGDMSGITDVRVKDSAFGRLKSIGRHARAQVWVYRPFEGFDRQLSTSDTASEDTRYTPTLIGSSSYTASRWSDTSTYVASTNPTSGYQQTGGHVLLRNSVPSQLVLFAKRQVHKAESLRFISVPIDQETRLSPENCHCAQPQKQCTRIVIKRSGSLDVKVHDNKEDENKWNLAVLGHPQHTEVGDNLELLKNVDFVAIDFETVEKRQAFAACFEATCLEMRNKVHSYWPDKMRARHLTMAT